MPRREISFFPFFEGMIMTKWLRLFTSGYNKNNLWKTDVW